MHSSWPQLKISTLVLIYSTIDSTLLGRALFIAENVFCLARIVIVIVIVINELQHPCPFL